METLLQLVTVLSNASPAVVIALVAIVALLVVAECVRQLAKSRKE